MIVCLDDETKRSREGPIYAGIVAELAAKDLPSLLENTDFLMSGQHWKLNNIVFIVAKLGNLCFESGEQKCF